jgi:hypothetical protein
MVADIEKISGLVSDAVILDIYNQIEAATGYEDVQ